MVSQQVTLCSLAADRAPVGLVGDIRPARCHSHVRRSATEHVHKAITARDLSGQAQGIPDGTPQTHR